ncbi:SET and MYND domain-containing protein 4 isoform X1 [Mirounga leonina]|uniref:SET and MYND domain-containing protein 4 isoform X1 n=2 Tax=Mirounga leonina TaxID=9715 RepID=UPI00156C2C95|nr:SET and MYND domain-containing protein 4 isoform X1 [Mirounga leonina]XP_034883453.1 SET and MYND domain-containing protein 4 isoform X1 [Mirounga leonina]XP_034883454.1 SET and MYND domain-containing protein 4 isoform X1 [Mirounga leonina]
MDLPVDEWKSYIFQKWSLLPKSIQDTISTADTLRDIFLHSSSLLQPEDEMFLKSLSRGYLVGKEPNAPPFYREEGNKKFQKKDYMGATVLYSKGISHARPHSADISLCYANRSAALFYLDEYEMCLKDITRAQMHGYPESLQPKVTLRKVECLVTLGRLQEAGQTIRDLESNFAAKPSLAAAQFQILQRNLCRLKMKVQERENLTASFPATLTKAFEDMDLREENEQIPGASSSVSLCMDPLKGRCLIATKDILPGELLVKEDAFVSVLNPGERPPLHHGLEGKWDTRVTNGDLYCHRCLRHTLATVPCDGCSYAKYCSHECMQQAWDLYHNRECPLGGLLLTLGIFCHIALRSTLLARFEDASEVIRKLCVEMSNKDMCSPESENLVQTPSSDPGGKSEENGKTVKAPVPGCDLNGKYENNYNAVFHLMPHTENHSPEYKFLCAVSVSALCRQLAAAESSKPATAPPARRAELRAWGVAMLKHMLQLQCNAQALTSLQRPALSGPKENSVTNSRQVRLATGIFPVVSLLNHSCSPNTSVSFISTVATIRASEKIGKGQEILHCYGPHRSRMAVAERRQKLRSQYFFDCGCPACQKEKHRAAVGPRWEAFCCDRCRAPLQGGDVLSCGSTSCTESVSRDHLISRLQDLQQQVGQARKLLTSGQLERAIQLLLGCRHDAESFLSAEHSMVGEMEDALAQAYAALGDWQKSATHLQKSLRVVEVQHGPSSVEMGHELFKLAQLFFNGFAIPEALNTIQRAEKVLMVHYGPCNDEIQELQKMKSCLLDSPPISLGPSV